MSFLSGQTKLSVLYSVRVSITWGFIGSRSLLLIKLPKSKNWPQIAMFSSENVVLLVSMCSLSTAFALD